MSPRNARSTRPDSASPSKTGDSGGTGLDSDLPHLIARTGGALRCAPTSHDGCATRPPTDHPPSGAHLRVTLLQKLQGPAELRGLTEQQLQELAADIRQTINATHAETGGPLTFVHG